MDCKDDNTSNGEVGNRIFNMKSYWGESSKRPHVIFKRNSPMLYRNFLFVEVVFQ